MEDFLAIIILVVIILAIFAGISAVWGVIFMWAWNLIIASLFHGPHITFVQAFAFSILLSAGTSAMHFLTFGFFRKPTA